MVKTAEWVVQDEVQQSDEESQQCYRESDEESQQCDGESDEGRRSESFCPNQTCFF